MANMQRQRADWVRPWWPLGAVTKQQSLSGHMVLQSVSNSACSHLLHLFHHCA